MSKETFMRELISAYDKYVGVGGYGDHSTRGYTSSRYRTYDD